MPLKTQKIRSLVLDFDGTITKQDTIAVLAAIGQGFQRRHQNSISPSWQHIAEAYGRDYQNHTATYVPAADSRSTLGDELGFLRSLRDVEVASFDRVGQSGLFRGMDKQDFSMAGIEALRGGDVRLRDGFSEFLACAVLEKWHISVLSVNWSSSFITGVLSGFPIDAVIANETCSDGKIVGPSILGPPSEGTVLTTCLDKARALRALAEQEAFDLDATVYFGDSVSDIECLTATNGVVMSEGTGSTLMKTLERVGISVRPVTETTSFGGMVWAPSFRDIITAGFFQNLTTQTSATLIIAGRLTTVMCYYQGTVYECAHDDMGRKVATCKQQREFLAGGGGPYCTLKDTHAFHRLRVSQKCPKCAKLDGTKHRAKELLQSLRENVEKRAAAKSGVNDTVALRAKTLSETKGRKQ